MATALLAVAGGCVENDSLTLLNPEGPPVVTGAFVDVDEDPTYDINAAYAELYVGHALTYGAHKDINAGAEVTPAEFTSTSTSVRVILDELLDGSTIEQFKCACWNPEVGAGGVTLAADPTGCLDADDEPIGPLYSDSPDVDSCTGCPDDPATAGENEANRCEDVNNDGVPDDSVLKEGIATLTCTNAGFDPYTSGTDEGWYDPSGSQLIPSAGIAGIGPAIQLFPADVVGHFPTDDTCTLVVNPSGGITDKDGNALAATSIPFVTTPFSMFARSPAASPADATVMPQTTPPTLTATVSGTPAAGSVFGSVTITFNAPVPTAERTKITLTGVDNPISYTSNADRTAVTVRAYGGFGFNKVVTVTIPANLTDDWGNQLGVVFAATNDGGTNAYRFRTTTTTGAFALRTAAFAPVPVPAASTPAATTISVVFNEAVLNTPGNLALITATVRDALVATSTPSALTLTNPRLDPAVTTNNAVLFDIAAQGFSKEIEITVPATFASADGMPAPGTLGTAAKVKITTSAAPPPAKMANK